MAARSPVFKNAFPTVSEAATWRAVGGGWRQLRGDAISVLHRRWSSGCISVANPGQSFCFRAWARRTGLPTAVGPQRCADIAALLKHANVDIIVCDDGLQHYALARDIEIAVLDGVRRYGNGICLPAGPLREPTARLESVDLIVTNGLAARGEFAMRYLATHAHRIGNASASVALAEFADTTVHAVAAIGNPASFFDLLRRNGLRITQHVFADHHRFTRDDLTFGDDQAVIMTEKDAVKCEHFSDLRLWYVPIEVELPAVFERRFRTLLQELYDGQKIA